MLSSITKSISSLFGTKSDRDVKEIQPIVDEILEMHKQIEKLSNDGLRAKTAEFKKRIADGIAKEEEEMKLLRSKIDTDETITVDDKEKMYLRIDELEKEVKKKIEDTLNEILPEAFAVVKETSKRFKDGGIEVTANQFDRDISVRKENVEIIGEKALWKNKWEAAGNEITWDMVHYDVQLIGGIVLHQGKIAEMGTGEGKTLVATLPVYLNALPAKGLHVVTVNNYLAKRDSEWNAPLFEFHGLTVDCIDLHEPNTNERRQAYLADITYGTNNEFGFDYLRDNMSRTPEELVQRAHNYAIVDEVDSVLIDDARTPLIISGPTPKGDDQEFYHLKPRVEKLVNAQKSYVNSALNLAKSLLTEKAEKVDKNQLEKNEKEGGMALLRAHRGLPKSKTLIKFLSEMGNRAILQKTEN